MIRAFLVKLRFFFRATRFKVYFSVSSCERSYARPYPHSVSHGAVARNCPITFLVVHVDYVIISEVHHMTIDDSFRSPRTPRRRRQGQSRPDDAIRSLRRLSHCLWGLSWPDGVFCSPRGVQRHLRGLSWPDNNFRSPRGLMRVFQGLPLRKDIIRSPRGL